MPIDCMKKLILFCYSFFLLTTLPAQQRPRDLGIKIGLLPTGTNNAITDVDDVFVGHTTLFRGESIRTGVTAILPHQENIFQQKVPGAIYIGNGFGKLAGYSQVKELGNLETPIVLTNTLSVAAGINGLIAHTLHQNENVGSVNAVVGETNDGYLNDIRGRHVGEADVLMAISNARAGKVEEGSVGAGTGTVCFGWKGGIGTSSRVLPKDLGGYTVGVLVQTNFGGVLQVDGVPVGEELGQYAFKKSIEGSVDGSCMIVVATNAPLDARNLERIAKRAIMGLAKAGGIASNGSGDYVIAFSTAKDVRVKNNPEEKSDTVSLVRNDDMSPLFMATIEATEEAIINSLFGLKTMNGREGHTIEGLAKEKVVEVMKKYNRVSSR